MFSRDELEQAFAHFQSEVVKAAATPDWDLFANLFTADASYYEHAYGRFQGRDQISAWARRTMSSFPGSAMPGFPVAWHVVDTDRGWVVCEIRNVMLDPGDGSVHEASNITILHYAGDNQWSYEEDVYNPQKFLDMVRAWALVAHAHGTLSEEGRQWLAKYGGGVPQ
ncbi:nuclear transport factor 2 family protein [Jatrophihabitans sp.]|uniref:nuclear transport factor 2 family protein n=1 Tax=Jatrophihabitans sp. TaxID=1932789 RepID=UPI0030C685AD|nr:hypothetical protein [Jatrophihabitans sp.]